MSLLRRLFKALVPCFAIGLATIPAIVLAQGDPRLKQAAQHFVDLEDDKAKVILDELSTEGVADADVLLGYLYSDPLYEGRDYVAAVGAFERAAASGNNEALFQVAESYFWSGYSNWNLSAEEGAQEPTAQKVYDLLQRAAGNGPPRMFHARAARWRLAYICTFVGYDCEEDVANEALSRVPRVGNLRAIRVVFDVLRILRSGEADTPEGEKSLTAYVALGMADADPLVAGVASELFWHDFTSTEDCPVPGSLAVAGRLLAMGWDAEENHEWQLELEKCFSEDELEEEWIDLVRSLDQFIRSYSNQGNWHLWTCYQDPNAPSFGDCLLHAVRDHYFTCTKLSIIDYFRNRYEIHYGNSKRYARCREDLLESREG